MPPRLTPLPVRLARCLLGRFTVTTRAPLRLKRLPRGFLVPPASWNCQCLTDCRQSVCFAPCRDAAFDSIAGLARPHLATSRSVRSSRCHHLSTRVTSSNRSRRIRRPYPLTASHPLPPESRIVSASVHPLESGSMSPPRVRSRSCPERSPARLLTACPLGTYAVSRCRCAMLGSAKVSFESLASSNPPGHRSIARPLT